VASGAQPCRPGAARLFTTAMPVAKRSRPPSGGVVLRRVGCPAGWRGGDFRRPRQWTALSDDVLPGLMASRCSRPPSGASTACGRLDSYLVDSASSHMLVSKIKPCMSKYKQLYGETANGSLNQLSFI
jgi:hypothetical protein